MWFLNRPRLARPKETTGENVGLIVKANAGILTDSNQVRAENSSYGETIANTNGERMSGAAAASLMLLR